MSGPKKWVQTRLGRSRSSDKFSSNHSNNGGTPSSGDAIPALQPTSTDHSRGTVSSGGSGSASPPRALGRVSSYEREVAVRNGGMDISPGPSTPRGSPGTPKKSWERHYKSFLSRKGGSGKDKDAGKHAQSDTVSGAAAAATFASATRSASAPASTLSMPALKSSKSLGAAAAAPSQLKWKTTSNGEGSQHQHHHHRDAGHELAAPVAGGRYAGEMGGHALDQSHRGRGGRGSGSLLALSPGGSAFKVSASAGLTPSSRGHGSHHHHQLQGQLQHPSSAPAGGPKQLSPSLIDDDVIDDLPAPPLLTTSSSSLPGSVFGSSSGSSGTLLPKGGGHRSRSVGSGAGGSGNGEKAVRGGSLFKNVFKHTSGGGGGKNKDRDKLEAKSEHTPLHRHNDLDASGRHGHGGGSPVTGNRRKSLSMDDLDTTTRKGKGVSLHGNTSWNVANAAAANAKQKNQNQQQQRQGGQAPPSPAPATAAATSAAHHRPAATYYSHDNAGDVTVRAGAAGTAYSQHNRPTAVPTTRCSIPEGIRGRTKSDGQQGPGRRLRTHHGSHGGRASTYHQMLQVRRENRIALDELDESRRSREKRMAFTEFHNSQRFGKDSTSPYLGDDPSVTVRDGGRGGYISTKPGGAPPASPPAAPDLKREAAEAAVTGTVACSCAAVATEGGGGPHAALAPAPAPASPYKSLLEAVDEHACARRKSSVPSLTQETGEEEAGADADAAARLPDAISNGDATALVEEPVAGGPSGGRGVAVLDPIRPNFNRSCSDLGGESGVQVGSEGDADRAYLVAPTVLSLCPPGVLAALSGGGTRSASAVPLGRAFSRRTMEPDDGSTAADRIDRWANDGTSWSSGSFVLHNNYLLEYDDHCSVGVEEGDDDDGGAGPRSSKGVGHLPRGYAHLQDSVVHPYQEGRHENTLQLDFSSAEHSSVGHLTAKLLIRLSSRDERDQWIAALVRAARLTAHDLYDFDASEDAHVLGRGRYATVRPARWNAGRLRPAVSERVLNVSAKSNSERQRGGGDRHRSLPKGLQQQVPGLVGPLVHSRSSAGDNGQRRNSGGHHSSSPADFHRDEYDCALKIVNKAEFLSRVRRGHERSDALTREVAVQSALAAHVKETGCPSSPFLGLRGFFETREDIVLELELLEGTDLFRFISAKGRPLEEAEAARFMRDLLSCLDLMNGVGIAHRDVKPANIFMCSGSDEEGCNGGGGGRVSVKLGDFGMAAFADPNDGLLRGRCGTPGYVAPEIFRTGPNTGYANKVDVFSAGVTLHVMLCGYEPFYGESEKELVEANRRGKVEFDPCDWAGVSVEGRDLVEKMLHIDPNVRISAADALQHPWIKRRAPPLERTAAGSYASPSDAAESCTLS